MKNYLKTLLAAALTFASSVSAGAQTTNLQAELVSGTEYYMYSIGHGLFVNGGGAWNEQAILSTTPMKVKMAKASDGTWTIFNSTTTDRYFKREIAAGADMVFVDGKKGTAINWKITDMGEHKYKLQAGDAAGDTDGCMGVRSDISNTQTNNCVYGPYFGQAYNEKDCLWAFVKAEDYTEDMKPLIAKTAIRYATETTPYDFQYMLKSPSCTTTDGWAVDGTLGNKTLLKVGEKDQEGFTNHSNIEYWKGANDASDLTGRMYYRLSSMPAGTYRLTADIYEKDLDASTITTRPDFFFGDTRMEFASSMPRTTKVFYAQHKADGDLDFGFTLPAGKTWVIIDDIKLEAVGGPNAILTSVEDNATYSGNMVTADNTCANYNLVDDKYGMNNIATAFTAENVTYNRQLTSDKKTTVCLPFNLTEEEVLALGSFYALKGLSGNTLTFENAPIVEANKPYLFIPKTSAFAKYTYKEIAVTPESLSQTADGTATMIGTLQRTTLRSSESEVLYAYNNGEFVKISSTADAYLPAFRAYISVPAATASKLLISLDDQTTGISTGTVNDNADASLYTADGVKVSKPARKGLYIKNGKKFIVK